MNGPFSEFWHLNSQTFLTPVFMPIFSLGYSSSLCFHIYIKQFFAWRVICKLIYKSQRIWNQRTVYEYRSTFCVIKYMNRFFFFFFFCVCFFKGQVYDWGWCPNTDSHIRTNNITVLPTPQPPPPPPPPGDDITTRFSVNQLTNFTSKKEMPCTCSCYICNLWSHGGTFWFGGWVTSIGCNGRNSEGRKNGRLSVFLFWE